jgi:SAM-dependent methyltransferase
VEDASFDVAICQQGLQFFPDKPAALAEMRRALRPDGRLAVATWTDVEQNPFHAVIQALEKHLGEESAQVLNSPFRVRADELERLVTDAGFGDVQVVQETQECAWAATPEEFAARTIAAGPLAQTFAAAPEEVRAAVAADAAGALRPHATGGGIRMPMTSNVAFARR